MSIPLEDNYTDIIGKAQRGLHLPDSELAERAGVSVETIHQLRSGDFDAAAAERIAAPLGLNPRALVELGEKRWMPPQIDIEGLRMFNTPFSDIFVNAYLAFDAESREAVIFDTGADCSEMLEFLEKNNLSVRWILLTHTHVDHIFDLDRLKMRTDAPAYVSRREPLEGAEPIDEGTEFELGKIHVRARLTSGHSAGGLTYLVDGLSQPVAIVGDSLFAGSMGGGMVSYADALRNNREKILTLPDETVVCPGHGPMTTVGEEKVHNPFFAT